MAVGIGVRHRPGAFLLSTKGGWPKPDTSGAAPSVSGFGRIPPIDGRAVAGRCLTPTPHGSRNRSQASARGVSAADKGRLAEARHLRRSTLGVWLRPKPADRWPGRCRPMPDSDPAWQSGSESGIGPGRFRCLTRGCWPNPDTSCFGRIPSIDGRAVAGRCLTPILHGSRDRSQASARGVSAVDEGRLAEARHLLFRRNPADRWSGRCRPMPDSDPAWQSGSESGIGPGRFRCRRGDAGRSQTPPVSAESRRSMAGPLPADARLRSHVAAGIGVRHRPGGRFRCRRGDAGRCQTPSFTGAIRRPMAGPMAPMRSSVQFLDAVIHLALPLRGRLHRAHLAQDAQLRDVQRLPGRCLHGRRHAPRPPNRSG